MRSLVRLSFSIFAVLVSTALMAQDRVYVPYTQTEGVSPTALALSASNDFVISYVVPSGRHRATKPPSVCPVGFIPSDELPLIVPYDTTFRDKFVSVTDREDFIAAMVAAKINKTLKNSDPSNRRVVTQVVAWEVDYTSHGNRDSDFRFETTDPKIRAIKDAYGAEVFFLVGERGDFAGTAAGPGNRDGSLAFAVAAYDGVLYEASASYLFGSNIGARAQVELEPDVNPVYAHEFVSPPSYKGPPFCTAGAACRPGDTRVDTFSSPVNFVNGEPAGVVGVSEVGNRLLADGFKTIGAKMTCVPPGQ